MPKPFLMESFEKHKAKGIARFRMGELEEAKYHFLKAAEYLLKLAQESEGGLREARLKRAQELVDLARNVKERKRAIREKAAAGKAGAPPGATARTSPRSGRSPRSRSSVSTTSPASTTSRSRSA